MSGQGTTSTAAQPIHYDLDVWFNDQDIVTLHAEVAAAEDARQAALLHYELGRIALAQGNEMAAVESLLRSYTMRPQFRPAIRLARLVCHQRRDYKVLARLLEAEAMATLDPSGQVSLMQQQARVQWRRLGDLDGALAVLEQSRKIQQRGDWNSLLMQDLIHLARDDAGARRAALQEQLEMTTDPRLRAALQVDLALLLTGVDAPAAGEVIRGAALSAPGSVSVLAAMEQVCLATDDHAGLVETIVHQAALPELNEEMRARLLARAGRIARDQLGQPKQATALLLRSLEQRPGFSSAADCLALLLEQERYPSAATVAGQLFDLDSTPSFRSSVAFMLGDLYRRRLDDPAGARTWYIKCLEVAPDHWLALEEVAPLLERTGEIEQLIRLHRAALPPPAGAAPTAALYRLASLQRRHGLIDDAVATHEQILAGEDDFLPSVVALGEIYAARKRWPEMIDVMERRIALAPDAGQQADTLESMAHVWRHRLDRPEKAIACYQRALELDPGRSTLLRAVRQLCEESGQWHVVVEVIEQEIAMTVDPRRKLEILKYAGEIWEKHLENVDQAMLCYQRALSIDSEYLPALQALGRLYRSTQRWADLIDMHETEIAACSSPEQIVFLLDAVAEIYTRRLGDVERAAATYRAILDRKPHYMSAVLALWRILEERSEWKELVELLQSTLDGLGNNLSRAQRLWHIGRLREDQLDDAGGAIRDYKRALLLVPDYAPAKVALARLLDETSDTKPIAHLPSDLLGVPKNTGEYATISLQLVQAMENQEDPLDASALRQRSRVGGQAPWLIWLLSQVYEKLGKHEELVEALDILAEATPGDRAAIDILARMARVMSDTGRGDLMSILAEYLRHEPESLFALRTLEDLARAADDPTQLAVLVRLRARREVDPGERAILLVEQATLQWRSGDLVGAEESYRSALEASDGQISAVWGLGQLMELQERWEERVELAEQEAAIAAAPEVKADAFTAAARVCQAELKDVDRAVWYLERARDARPGHPESFALLRTITQAQRQWPRLADLLDEQALLVEDPRQVVGLLVEFGRICVGQLEDPARATAALVRASELDVDNGVAPLLLADIRFDLGDYAAAEPLYARAGALLSGPRELIKIHGRLGDIHLALQRPGQALAEFQKLDFKDSLVTPEILRRAAEAAEIAGDAATRVSALEELARRSEDQLELQELRRDAAQLVAQNLEDPQRAIQILNKVLEHDPLDLKAIEQLADIYGRVDDRTTWDRHLTAAVGVHQAALEKEPFNDTLYWQLGRIFRWQLRFDALYCSFCSLVRLRELDSMNRSFFEAYHGRCAQSPHGALSADEYDGLLIPNNAQAPLRDLLLAAGDGLARGSAQDPSDFGLDRGHRVESRHLREPIDAVAGVLGLDSAGFDVWRSPRGADVVHAAFFARPALILGGRLLDTPPGPGERYLIGRGVALLQNHAQVMPALYRRGGRLLFATLAGACKKAVALDLDPEERALVDEQARVVGRAMSRKARRRLDGLLDTFEAPPEDVEIEKYTWTVHLAANRAGLLAAGDPVVAMETAAGLFGGGQSQEVGDLMRFMVSDEYSALRLKHGLAADPR